MRAKYSSAKLSEFLQGSTLQGAAGEAKKSVNHVETLQLSLTQCAKDKQNWLQERAKLINDVKIQELNFNESESQRSLSLTHTLSPRGPSPFSLSPPPLPPSSLSLFSLSLSLSLSLFSLTHTFGRYKPTGSKRS